MYGRNPPSVNPTPRRDISIQIVNTFLYFFFRLSTEMRINPRFNTRDIKRPPILAIRIGLGSPVFRSTNVQQTIERKVKVAVILFIFTFPGLSG